MGEFPLQIIYNPPYSAHVQHPELMPEDPRFNEYGKYAPKTKADLAFVQHMVYHMDDDGRVACLLPHGVLFRGSAEETIRKYLIEKLNVVDAIIGLPANLFYGTGIPVCVLVLKKNRNGNSNDILFIDASKEFEPGKNQNVLRQKDIEKIVETYRERVDVEKYAHVATMDEIVENGYNLNIPRYVDTSEEDEEIDIAKVKEGLVSVQTEKQALMDKVFATMQELGL